MFLLTIIYSAELKCDDDKRVIQVDIRSDVGSLLELCYVPPKVKILNISGSFNTGKLTGSVDLTELPAEMEWLSLHHNQLTGEVDLTQLPDGMETLGLKNNQLTGEVDLTQLPNEMQYLRLENNQFSGRLDLLHLPNGMKELHAESNQFSASLIIKRIPQGMKRIDARGNPFDAVAVVESETLAWIMLHGSGVNSVVDENGKEVSMKRLLR